MQTQYKDIRDLAQAIHERAAGKQDFVADTTKIDMTLVGSTPALTLNGSESMRLGINGTAHDQIAGRLNIPTKYYDRMLAESPELLVDNVNHWLHKTSEKRLVRTIGGTTRAFLSDRYQRIENEEVFETIMPVLMEQAEMQVVSSAITESRMYIKAVFPRVAGEVAKGDAVQAGLVISNSEVGKGAVSIKPLVYRLVCLNGMVIEDAKYTARHVGARITEDDAAIYALLSDSTKRKDDEVVLEKIQAVVRHALDQATFSRRLSDMRGAAEDKLEGNPAEAVKVLAKKMSFTEGEQGSILRHLIEGGDISRWGVLNAVTRSAQDTEDYDRATELETAGGQILYLPRSEWQHIAQAA